MTESTVSLRQSRPTHPDADTVPAFNDELVKGSLVSDHDFVSGRLQVTRGDAVAEEHPGLVGSARYEVHSSPSTLGCV